MLPGGQRIGAVDPRVELVLAEWGPLAHLAAGQIGQPPTKTAFDFQYTMNTLGRLTTPEQFGDIILKIGSAGQTVRATVFPCPLTPNLS